MGTSHFCKHCLDRVHKLSVKTIKEELEAKSKISGKRKRSLSCTFLDEERKVPRQNTDFLPLLPQKYSIPKKAANEDIWDGRPCNVRL